jgi:hypothetical protein
MKINTKELQRSWSAWVNATSQATHFSVKHGDKCLLEGECEIVRDGKHTTLVFPGPKKKPEPRPALNVRKVAKAFEVPD